MKCGVLKPNPHTCRIPLNRLSNDGPAPVIGRFYPFARPPPIIAFNKVVVRNFLSVTDILMFLTSGKYRGIVQLDLIDWLMIVIVVPQIDQN